MLLRWLLLIPFALVCALISGSFAFLIASLLDPVLAQVAGETLFVGFWALVDAVFAVEDPAVAVEGAASALGEVLFTFFVVAPGLVALVGEIVGTRALLWYAGAGAILTGAMPWLMRDATAGTPEEWHVTLALAVAGAVAGLVYWLIAGRSAGAPARDPA